MKNLPYMHLHAHALRNSMSEDDDLHNDDISKNVLLMVTEEFKLSYFIKNKPLFISSDGFSSLEKNAVKCS